MPTKRHHVGLFGAISIGLASMLGAGVFVVFGSAYELAGNWLFIALLLAGTVASLNAASVFQLARQVDRAGGAYSYARTYRSKTLSFVAGFAFVFGKIGSVGAIALALANYLWPDQAKLFAVGVVLLTVLANALGIQRTAGIAAVLSITTSAFLIFAVVFGLFHSKHFTNPSLNLVHLPHQDVAAAAAVIFFAFAGYARIANMGREVNNPKRNIPLAIVLALAFVLALYLALAEVLVAALGPELVGASSPFVEYFASLGTPLDILVKFVAVIASLGSILALLAGVSRTAATMAEDRELPKIFASRNRFGSPWLAELTIAAGACILVFTGSLTAVIGFSSFSVLIYYSIAHLSAIAQPRVERAFSPGISWIGFALCLWLAFAVPGYAALVSVPVIALAVGIRAIAKARTQG